jgi:hypothetical protein
MNPDDNTWTDGEATPTAGYNDIIVTDSHFEPCPKEVPFHNR